MQLFGGFTGLIHVFPIKTRAHARQGLVATLAPKPIQGLVIGRAQRVVFGAFHPAKRHLGKAQGAGVGLAVIKKLMANAAPTIARQQHRFGAVKNLRHIKPAARKGGGEIIGMIGQRRARGRAHQICAIKGPHQNRMRALAIGFQIAALVV